MALAIFLHLVALMVGLAWIKGKRAEAARDWQLEGWKRYD